MTGFASSACNNDGVVEVNIDVEVDVVVYVGFDVEF